MSDAPMTLLQLVITKNTLGQYKLCLMGLNGTTHMGETFETYRGECWYILWKLIKVMARLRPPARN